jgi:hypothetical protein
MRASQPIAAKPFIDRWHAGFCGVLKGTDTSLHCC